MRNLWLGILAVPLVLVAHTVTGEASAQVSGAIPGIPDAGPIPVFTIEPTDGSKVVALSGRIKNGVLDISSVEVRAGYAPEDFGGAQRVVIDLLGANGGIIHVESFLDPRRVEELDSGQARAPADVPFDIAIPYRSGTTELRLNLPLGLRPAASQKLLNGVELFSQLSPAPAMRIDLRGAFSNYCRTRQSDADCQAVLGNR